MENVKPKVSIIVPVYKAENTLHRCLKSIIQQSLKEIEVILVDDGSPDRSGAICDEYGKLDPRVKVIHRNNGGESRARNDGMRIAQGEYIGFVDSDDYVEHNMYEVLYRIAESANVDIVNCGHFCENADGVKQLTSGLKANKVLAQSDVVLSIRSFENDLDEFWFVWRNLYRRTFLEAHAITFDEGVKYGPDTNFNLLAFYYARSSYSTDQHLYHYVENPNGLLCAKFKEAYLEQLSSTYQKRLEFFEKIGFDAESSVRGLSATVIERFLISLLFNAWESPRRDFLKQAAAIRDSGMVSESFLYYEPRGKVSLFLRSVIALMKHRMHPLLYVLFTLRQP
jgi:glycosyltransferase EpsJ